MSSTLFLWPQQQTWHWLQTDEHGRNPQAAGQDERLPRLNASRVVLLVPAWQVTLASLELPPLSRAKLRQALPYALEEWVATDVEALLIAHGGYLDDGRLPVAAIEQRRIDAYLSTLQAAGYEVNVALPDALCLPWHENGLSLAPCAGGWLYRHGIHDGGFVEDDNLATLLELIAAEGQAIDVYGASSLPSAIKVQARSHGSHNTLSALAPQAAHPNWQLLQTAATSSEHRQWRGLGRWAAILGGLLLATAYAHTVLEWWLLKQAAREEQQQASAIFERLFPGQPLIDARLQTERLLGQNSGSRGDFLRYLGQAAPLLAASETIQLNGLDYDGQALVLRLRAPVVAELDDLSQQLNAQGVNARVLNASLAADGVDGAVRISGGGPS
ncbi:MAG: hypothetical protein Tsb002_18070 [Wenzhouxiangellaceae bacterium]